MKKFILLLLLPLVVACPSQTQLVTTATGCLPPPGTTNMNTISNCVACLQRVLAPVTVLRTTLEDACIDGKLPKSITPATPTAAAVFAIYYARSNPIQTTSFLLANGLRGLEQLGEVYGLSTQEVAQLLEDPSIVSQYPDSVRRAIQRLPLSEGSLNDSIQ